MAPRVPAFVFLKPLAEGKSRLAAALTPERRSLLALGMLVRVLNACHEAPSIARATVVGGDGAVRGAAAACGAAWQPEPERGLNAAVRRVVVGAAAASGDVAALFLPGDLALVTAVDIEVLLAALSAEVSIVIAPDRRQRGTNALVLRGDLDFVPAFGEDSFERHVAEARRLGFEPYVCRRQGLGLDIDEPGDLARLEQLAPRWWQETEAQLASLGLSSPSLAPRAAAAER